MTRFDNPALAETIASISVPDPRHYAQARSRLDSLTKPLGSLGRLESIAAQVVAIRSGSVDLPLKKAVYVFAADHGIVSEGVSAYPKEVTLQMVMNFLSEGAAINVLARLHHAELTVIDVGVDATFDDLPGLMNRKVCRGSQNMLHEKAMTDSQLMTAIDVGLELARSAHGKQLTLIAVGEMGIGNTTAASAITALLTTQPVEAVTGRGTGLNDASTKRKISVIEAVLQKHFDQKHYGDSCGKPNSLDILQCVGGLEIAAMTGMFLGSARHRIPVIADGFISTAAAALAYAIEPKVKEYILAGHCSEEPGHRFLLQYLGLNPILSLEMRLGEGTGAVLAMPIIESALRLYAEMTTFASAGVSEAKA